MINSNEVRRGSLVQYDNRIFEIDTISEEYPTLNTEEFGIGVVDWNNIEGIPLTEEWLLKFGFEQNVDGEFFFCLKENGSGILKINAIYDDNDGRINVCLSLDDKSNEDCFAFWICDIEKVTNVHTLQNLYFALTGTELTYNL